MGIIVVIVAVAVISYFAGHRGNHSQPSPAQAPISREEFRNLEHSFWRLKNELENRERLDKITRSFGRER